MFDQDLTSHPCVYIPASNVAENVVVFPNAQVNWNIIRMLFLKGFQSVVKSDIYKQGLGKDNKYFYYMHAIRHDVILGQRHMFEISK